MSECVSVGSIRIPSEERNRIAIVEAFIPAAEDLDGKIKGIDRQKDHIHTLQSSRMRPHLRRPASTASITI